MSAPASSNLIKSLDNFLSEMSSHSVFKNPYFKYLSSNKWTPKTYELFRANFFYRTELTVKGIALVCARSAAANDMDTLILFSYILGEETGMGKKPHCHEIFMERALNQFGREEFSLKPMPVQQAEYSSFIIPETIIYRERIQSLMSKSYPRMLGVVMALENHADRMLSAFRDAFRLNRYVMDKETFLHNVEAYFNIHIESGVEDRHAEDARRCVINNCKSQSDLDEIMYGATGMLEMQQQMWEAMYQKTKHLEDQKKTAEEGATYV